jgi:hypothetical protein
MKDLCGIDSLESIPGLLNSLKIPAAEVPEYTCWGGGGGRDAGIPVSKKARVLTLIGVLPILDVEESRNEV